MQTYLCIYVCVCALNLCTKHKHILFGARLPLHPIAAMHIASMCKMVGKHTTAETWGINSALALAEKNTLNDSPPWPTIVVQTTVITSVAVMRNTHVLIIHAWPLRTVPGQPCGWAHGQRTSAPEKAR